MTVVPLGLLELKLQQVGLLVTDQPPLKVSTSRGVDLHQQQVVDEDQPKGGPFGIPRKSIGFPSVAELHKEIL